MTEIWKPWPKNPKYQVSNLGRVKSQYKILKCAPQKTCNGYIRVYVGGGKAHQKLEYVHRMVAETFLPNPNNKPQVNHIDSNKSNNCVANLEWVTCKENALHGAKKGHYKGAKSKFTKRDAERWAEMRNAGVSLREIARQEGTSHPTIIRITEKYGL